MQQLVTVHFPAGALISQCLAQSPQLKLSWKYLENDQQSVAIGLLVQISL